MKRFLLPVMILIAVILLTSLAGAEPRAVPSIAGQPARFISVGNLLINLESVSIMEYNPVSLEKGRLFIHFINGESRSDDITLSQPQWDNLQARIQAATLGAK